MARWAKGGTMARGSEMGTEQAGAAHAASPVCLAVIYAVALACDTAQTWLLNNAIFPVTSEVFPLAREIQTLAGIAVGVFVLLAAMRLPRLLRPMPLLLGSLILTAASSVVLVLAPDYAAAVTAGLVGRAVGQSFPFYLIGLAYAQLGPSRLSAASIAGALLVETLITSVLPAPGYVAGVWLSLALCAICAALLWRSGVPLLANLSQTQGAELRALASPRSFLSPFHQVYVLSFIFSVAFGFALALRISLFTPAASNVQIVVVALVVIWFLLPWKGRAREDALFAVAALLVVAGFLLAPLESLPNGALSNGLLYAGNTCFRILLWIVLAALCSRNIGGSLLVLACGAIASSAGTFVGADLGHLCNALLSAVPEAAALVSGSAVLGLFAYVLLGLRGFSFAETIRDVEPESEPDVAEASTPSRDELIDAACDKLTARCGLTEREREVLGMLARGHNGYHIRDELTLSYNTVKTHVKRIYRKLDVHSQQELIDLVDAGTREAA